MTSIGPQIPEHLLEQKKSDENKFGNLGEEAGPIPEATSVVPIGPQIPDVISSSVAEREEEDDDDEYGPALPPELLTKRPSASGRDAEPVSSARSSSSPASARRVIGPSLPGAGRQSHDSDEEDGIGEYGPMPLPEVPEKLSAMSEGVREFLEREERRKQQIEEAAKPKKPKREEWMLVPPSSSDLLGRLGDPTKLKARQFSRGGNTASRSAPNNLWTETPEERQQRVADEVAGKKRRAANAEDDASDDRDVQRKRQRDLELRKVVNEHNKSSRGKTLVEMHEEEKKKEKKTKKDEDDDKPVAIWDHSRDMSLGGRLMDEKQRRKMISEAGSLGDRFGSGKSGGYL
ncbi:hypothetical protein ACEPAH_102 [Sanghuangporus vaninii]